MTDYEKLRNDLNEKPKWDHEKLIESFISASSQIDRKHREIVNDYSITGYEINDTYISTTVYGMSFGSPVMDDEGPYQDSDGDSFDVPEGEFTLSISIYADSVECILD